MMNNNWQKLNIWLGLKNRFDFEEFKAACKTEGIEPQSIMEFAQKAGMLSCAMTMFPDLPVQEAYWTFIQLNNGNNGQPTIETKDRPEYKPCGGCGGGKVR